MKTVRYIFEAIIATILYGLFKILPPPMASNIGGWLGQTIGPHLAANRKAHKHLKIAFPDISEQEKTKIIKKMWDNFGRIFAEYPHLKTLSRDYTQIENYEILEPYIKANKPVIFIGAHLGNWEINCPATLTQLDHPMTLTYRAPNNPWIDKLLTKARNIDGRLKALPKSRASGKHIMQTMKENGFLGILIDQKYNEGIESTFFKHPTMTNPIFAQLAQKYECPVIPVRCERIEGCQFKLTIHPSIETHKNEEKRPIEEIINDAHTLLENWITEKPEQWIWLHRRWKS